MKEVQRLDLIERYTLIGKLVLLTTFFGGLGGWMTGYYLFGGSLIGSFATALVVGSVVFLLDKLAVSGRKMKSRHCLDVKNWLQSVGTLLLRLMITCVMGTFFSTSLVISAFTDNIKRHLEKEIDHQTWVLNIQQEQMAKVTTRARIDAAGKVYRYADGDAEQKITRYKSEEKWFEFQKASIRRGDPTVLTYGRMLIAVMEMGFTTRDKNAEISADIGVHAYNAKGELRKGLSSAQVEGSRHLHITPDGWLHLVIFVVFLAIDSAPILYKTFFMPYDAYDDWFWVRQEQHLRRNRLHADIEGSAATADRLAENHQRSRYREAKNAYYETLLEAFFSEESKQEILLRLKESRKEILIEVVRQMNAEIATTFCEQYKECLTAWLDHLALVLRQQETPAPPSSAPAEESPVRDVHKAAPETTQAQESPPAASTEDILRHIKNKYQSQRPNFEL